MEIAEPPTPPAALLPSPPSERGSWLLACAIAVLGMAVLGAVLAGVVGRTQDAAPPPIRLTATPAPGVEPPAAAIAPGLATVPTRTGAPPAGAKGPPLAAIVARPTSAQQRLEARRLSEQPQVAIATRWMEGFYPIYATAQSTFGVNWLLLASIHMQESAFSTAPSTYRGLNFAHCCGGPMQFNVTNGPVTTWDLVGSSYRYGRRPVAYDHMTAGHPSIYDDFDAIMAAAHLLSADGAEYGLDAGAWGAAYDYYGHDATGVDYADRVIARAIGWSQHGFCINCGVDPAIVGAVHAAYGAPVLAALSAAPPPGRPAAKPVARPAPAKAGR
jgi:hypothetical protein